MFLWYSSDVTLFQLQDTIKTCIKARMFWVLLLKSDIRAKVAPTPAPCREGGRRYPAPKRVKGFWHLPSCCGAPQLYLSIVSWQLYLFAIVLPLPPLDCGCQDSWKEGYCMLQISFGIQDAGYIRENQKLLNNGEQPIKCLTFQKNRQVWDLLNMLVYLKSIYFTFK